MFSLLLWLRLLLLLLLLLLFLVFAVSVVVVRVAVLRVCADVVVGIRGHRYDVIMLM